MRIQIPAYTDRWMMGDRFGTVVKVITARNNPHGDDPCGTREIAHVKLDVSGKTVRVILDHCSPV